MKAALGLALVVLVACSDSEQDREEAAMASAVPHRLQADGSIVLSDADRKALDLTIEPAVAGELPATVIRFGAVRARAEDEAVIVSPVAARVVNRPTVALGDSVTAGQAMIEVQPLLGVGERTSIAVQGADLAAQVAVAQNDLAARTTELTRTRGLAADKLVTTAALQNAEAAAATAKARVDGLRNARAVQGRSGATGAVTLRAPVDGTIASFDAVIGSVVEPATPLARIVRPGPRWVDVGALPEDPKGEGYEIETGGRWVPAKLLNTGTAVGVDGLRIDRVEVAANDAARLLPGASAQVRVGAGAGKGVIVPDSALVQVPNGTVVYVETSPSRFASRAVDVAARFGGRARIAQGIRAGERVVTRGAMSMRGESLRSELRHTE